MRKETQPTPQELEVRVRYRVMETDARPELRLLDEVSPIWKRLVDRLERKRPSARP